MNNRPTHIELQLSQAKEPVEHVGRSALSYSPNPKIHIRREKSTLVFDRKPTLCGLFNTMNYEPVESLEDISEITCMACRRIAGLGPIPPRKS